MADPYPEPVAFGAYEILGELGRGGMGVVYRARQVNLDRPVALKVLADEYARNSDYLQRFYREARAAARLNHPGIVQVHDFGEHDGVYFIAMEFVDGQSLAALLEERGRLPEAEAVRITRMACDALDYLHRNGLVHRDVKPDNFMFDSLGNLKLCDMGLAKMTAAEDLRLTVSGAAVGTPYYISPEQIRADKDIDARSDLYSLGATLYQMLTGEVPYSSTTSSMVMAMHLKDPVPDPRQKVPELSFGISQVVFKLMEKDRARRYSSAKDLATDLDRVVSGEFLPRLAKGPAALPAPSTPGASPVEWVRPTAPSPVPRASEVVFVGQESSEARSTGKTFAMMGMAACLAFGLGIGMVYWLSPSNKPPSMAQSAATTQQPPARNATAPSVPEASSPARPSPPVTEPAVAPARPAPASEPTPKPSMVQGDRSPRPDVQTKRTPVVGDTEEEVLAVMGVPKGSMVMGTDEKVLSYDRGEVTIRSGKVAAVELLPENKTWSEISKKQEISVSSAPKVHAQDAQNTWKDNVAEHQRRKEQLQEELRNMQAHAENMRRQLQRDPGNGYLRTQLDKLRRKEADLRQQLWQMN